MQGPTKHNESLKVVHLNASSAGGAFVAAQRLSKALDGLEGVESEHWVFEGGEGDFHLWATGWLKKKWAVGLHALEKLDFLRFEKEKRVRFAFSHAKTGVNVSAWKSIQQADVIHLHWVNKGFVSLQGLGDLLKLNKKVVWTCHDMWPFTGGCYHPRGCDHFERACGNCHYLKSPGEADLSRRVFSAKQSLYQTLGDQLQFVTPSQWLKDQALKSGAINDSLRNGIKVIPNPIDTGYFHPKAAQSADSAQNKEGSMGLAADGTKLCAKPFILMFAAANLGNAAKGFAEYRWVCNELVSRGFTQVEALIVGENRIGDLGLKCKYRELGFIKDAEQMREAYWQSDVYVTTSHEENLPTTIMESLSCGVPVAAFAVGGIPEMLLASGEHQTGFLVPKSGVGLVTTDIFMEQLVHELSEYIVAPESRVDQIKQNCRMFAVQHYSAMQIALAYEQVYRT
jgi:glycosyltransferase involved in cell wall biosynthesis